MPITAADIELVLLRSIVERKETCEQAAQAVMREIGRIEANDRFECDEKMGRTTS